MNAPPASTGEEGASEEGEMNEGRQASEAETDTLPDDTGRCRLLVSRREVAGRKKGGGERGRERERGTGGGRGGGAGRGGGSGALSSLPHCYGPPAMARPDSMREREQTGRMSVSTNRQTLCVRECACVSVT